MYLAEQRSVDSWLLLMAILAVSGTMCMPTSLSAQTAAQPPKEITSSAEAPPASPLDRFVREVYLSPDIDRLDEFVSRNYSAEVTYYNKKASLSQVAADKRRWYDRWQSWDVKLVPGTLTTSAIGADRFQATFNTTYRWVPKTGKVLEGLAQVTLVLVASGDGYRIAAETSTRLK